MESHSQPSSSGRVLRVEAADPERTHEVVSRDFGQHTRVVRDSGVYGFSLTAAVVHRVAAGWQSAALPAVIKAATAAPTLHLPLRVGSEYRVGRRVLRSSPGQAVVLAAGHEYTVRSAAGPALGLRIDPDLLSEEIELCRTGSRRPRGFQSIELPLSGTAVATIHSQIQEFVRACDGARSGTTVQVMPCKRRLTALFAGLLLENAGVQPAPPSGLRLADEIDAWIRAHLGENINLEMMSAALKVGCRWLQKACMLRFGMSPLDLVLTRRLDAARIRLLAASSADSVTKIAVGTGFTHLGRFSVQYKAVFGESPRETLARARDRARFGSVLDPAA